MATITPTIIDRLKQISLATDAILSYDVADRIHDAQMELEFEEGIKVANAVTAELLADIHLLLDYHEQSWDEVLAAAEAKYQGYALSAESGTVE